jgi:hypothetical protein
MKIDPVELQQLAAAQPPRMDMYAGIHKALRAFMTETLLAVGRMDVTDEASLADTTAQLAQLLDFCSDHLRHENDFVHAAMEARAPGASGAIAHEHEEHLAHIAELRGCAAALAGQSVPARLAAAAGLYRELGRFVAHNFEHMHVEETAHNAVLWAHYTDAELAAIHDALVASIPPAEMMTVARWMLPAMNPVERAAVLGDMRGKAPAPAFEAVLATVRPHLSEVEWSRLASDLGLPPVPGLVTV